MIQKHFSSKGLLGTAIIATLVAWVALFGVSVYALWIVIPLAFWAWSRKHLKEKTRLAAEAGMISIAAAIIVFVFFSFLLPDTFMPWVVVSFVAVVPALVLGATVFFQLTKPVSRHERIHELEALTFFVVIVIALVFALPQIFLATALPADYAFKEATSDYWQANQIINQPLGSDSHVPVVLIEYSNGYMEELSALISFWQNSPPDRCIQCIFDSQAVLRERSFGAIAFASTARQVDRYLVMIEEDPGFFIDVEECVMTAPPRMGFDPVTKPSQAYYGGQEALFGRALERYLRHTDYYLAGYVLSERIMYSYNAAHDRSITIARSVAQSSAEQQVIELVAKQHAQDVSSCAVIY